MLFIRFLSDWCRGGIREKRLEFLGEEVKGGFFFFGIRERRILGEILVFVYFFGRFFLCRV